MTSDRTTVALKSLAVAETIIAVSVLTFVLLSAASPKAVRLTAADAAAPTGTPPCVASRQAGERFADYRGENRRSAFASATARCLTAMHTDMARALELERSADVVFATAMVPHHQGGVDMARELLLYGKDPELRAFALGIIAEQQVEIGMLHAWIKRHRDLDLPAQLSARQSPHPPGGASR